MKLSKLVVVSLVAVSFVGCKTYDPYTGEQKYNKTTKYGVGGAFAGAAIGAATGDSSRALKGAAIGAAAGGAAGTGYGYYADKQETELRAELMGTGVQVKRVGNDIQLIMPGDITFRSGSGDINASFYPVLNPVSKVLKKFDKTIVRIDGHTDSTGSAAINNKLSQERADSVAYYLNGRGVSGGRLVAVGYGSSRPIASNSTASGRSANRRVEIRLQQM